MIQSWAFFRKKQKFWASFDFLAKNKFGRVNGEPSRAFL